MHHLYLSIALLTWIWTALAKWAPLTKLESRGYLYTIYTDSATRYAYFQYVRSTTGYDFSACAFGIRRLKAGGILEPFHALFNATGDRCERTMLFPGDLVGNVEGTRLFSAMQVFRNVGPSIVGNEIVLQESSDQGKTWSLPVYIQRKDMKDRAVRYYPKFLLVKETGRLYMFYIVIKVDSGLTKAYIACITREKNSASFSSERPVFDLEGLDLSSMIPQMNAEYSYDGNKNLLLHLAWTGHGDKIYYAKSKDSGLTWSSPRPLAQTLPYKGVDLRRLNLMVTSGRLLLTYHSTEDVGYLLDSGDHGDTWLSVGNFTNAEVALLGISYAKCGNRLWLGSTEGTGVLQVTGYNPATRKFTKVSPLAFEQDEKEISRVCLACMGDGRLWFGDTLSPMDVVYSVNDGSN